MSGFAPPRRNPIPIWPRSISNTADICCFRSSRPGTQPANLQGVWNELVRPPWSSNWTANINVQMNYWPAETCNLAECHEPLFDLIEGLGKTGARTAQTNYGCRGWVSHHNVDIWRQSAPVGDFGSGLSDLGQLVHERRMVLRAPVGALRLRRRPRIPARPRLSDYEIGGRVLPRLADRAEGRPPDYVPFAIHREQFQDAGRTHSRDQRRLHDGYGADLRVVRELHRSDARCWASIPISRRNLRVRESG